MLVVRTTAFTSAYRVMVLSPAYVSSRRFRKQGLSARYVVDLAYDCRSAGEEWQRDSLMHLEIERNNFDLAAQAHFHGFLSHKRRESAMLSQRMIAHVLYHNLRCVRQRSGSSMTGITRCFATRVISLGQFKVASSMFYLNASLFGMAQ